MRFHIPRKSQAKGKACLASARLLPCLFACCFTAPILANAKPRLSLGKAAASEAPYRPSLVLITLDGVRTEEVFIGAHPWRRRRSYRDFRTRLLPFLWKKLARSPNTTILGNRYARKRRHRHYCHIDNPSGRSLPAYANLFSLLPQKEVKENTFQGRISHPSIFDRLHLLYDYDPKQFAFFTSWAPIRRVISQDLLQNWHIDTGYQNFGPRPPWHEARYDRETLRSVLRFLQKKPDFQFLFVGFNDSDEWGHIGSYRRYLRAIHRQDAYIRKIVRAVESNPKKRGRTLYLITTDHGRGRGRYWRQHSARLRGAPSLWAFLYFPKRGLLSPAKRSLLIQNLKKHCSHTGMARFTEDLFSI